jgi:hypothetical protein
MLFIFNLLIDEKGNTNRTTRCRKAQEFFEVIPMDCELAMDMLRVQVPVDGPPTPRAQEYVDNGEWDSSALLTLNFVPA